MSRIAGIEFNANTGRRHNEIHVACAKNAPKNLRGFVRIVSNLESWPSPRTRANRKLPTVHNVLLAAIFPGEGREKEG